MQTYERLLHANGGRRDLRTLADVSELQLFLGRVRCDGTIIHAVEVRHRRGDIGQDILLLHALTHHARDEFGKQHGRIRRVEKLFHHVTARALNVDVEALELALERVQTLQRRTAVVFARVELLENFAEAFLTLTVHALFELDVFEIVSHFPNSPFS